jgi:molybdate transport system substrate-binding protein
LKSVFQQAHPGVSFVFNFAGSQQLAQELAQGAQADLFASANLAQMEAAISNGKIDPGEVSAIIGNSLIIITPVGNPGQVASPVDLAKPGLKLILADKTVPVGAYTLDFLEKASTQPDFGSGFKEKVMENVVSLEENVRAVVSKIINGEADAGIVYLSDALKAGPTQVHLIQIPQEINVSVTYYLAPVKDSSQTELARRFDEFILSEQGQAILSRRGFIPIQ